MIRRYEKIQRKKARHQLVVDVEVDVEEVPDDDHGPELQRPRNAGGISLPVPLRRRRRGGGCRRPRPCREARQKQGRGKRPQPPANAAREHGRSGAGYRPSARRRRRREGRISERDVARGQRRSGGWAARRRPGSRRRGLRRRRRHALHLAALPLPCFSVLGTPLLLCALLGLQQATGLQRQWPRIPGGFSEVSGRKRGGGSRHIAATIYVAGDEEEKMEWGTAACSGARGGENQRHGEDRIVAEQRTGSDRTSAAAACANRKRLGRVFGRAPRLEIFRFSPLFRDFPLSSPISAAFV
jgi:hypothetical protein